jgi:hypothetical protein
MVLYVPRTVSLEMPHFRCVARWVVVLYNLSESLSGSLMQTVETSLADRLINGDARDFRQLFNRTSFLFSHHLAGNQLFEVPRLVQLARSMGSRPEDLYYDAGDIKVNQRWDNTPPCDVPIEETIRRIQELGAWIILKRVNKDPDYAVVLDKCLAQVQDLIGADLRQLMKVREAIIFITSPNRVTAYHIDRECNFLLQLRGHKSISIFDQNDREVLTEEELERFWAVDNNAAQYKEQYQDRARVYPLGPGDGVHIPVNAPHWVKNGKDISVTLSVNFTLRDSVRANAYRMNYFLRKLGIVPTPPGVSPRADGVKRFAMGSAIGTRNLFRRLRP